jgi:hypothetical protein
MFSTIGELGLAAQIDHWQLAWLKVLAAPHIEVYHYGNLVAQHRIACSHARAPYIQNLVHVRAAAGAGRA